MTKYAIRQTSKIEVAGVAKIDADTLIDVFYTLHSKYRKMRFG